MNKNLLSAAILGTLLSLTSATALAKLDASEIARLGQDLTPTGAEQAGNADGSIPAWSGGLTQPPAGYSAAKGYPVLFMRALKVTHFRQLDDPLTVFGLGGTIFGSVFTLSA